LNTINLQTILYKAEMRCRGFVSACADIPPEASSEGTAMTEATIPTWSLLPSLGFEPDSTVRFTEIRPGLSLDFGNFKLSAAALISPYSGEIVSFFGILATPRTLADVHFEMPCKVESLAQCAAWIVWNLDQHGDHRVFKPAREVAWLEEGRENRRLLPWVMSMAEWNARPKCMVKREWLRLALRTLMEHVAILPDDVDVAFSFDGSVFSIRCAERIIALAGEGPPWGVRFTVLASALRCLPKRHLMDQHVDVSIWKSRLTLGPWSYPGTVEVFRTTDPSKLQ
jgi:hypothetical protein